jgi:hypothetical protein
MVTYIIGWVLKNGGHIPIMVDGNKDLKRDESGQPVVTKLNETLMKQLAEKGQVVISIEQRGYYPG